MNTRRATAKDLDQLVELFNAYRQFYGRPPDIDGACRFLTERFEKDDSVIYVAEDTGLCIGFTQLFPSFSSVAMKRVWSLNEVYVSSDHRRCGVASQLIQAAIDFGRCEGAARLDLATATDSSAAQALYEAFGWKRDCEFAQFKYPL